MAIDYKAIVSGITEDHTEEVSNFEKREIPGGKCVARLVSYIEMGKQKQRAYQGQEKAPAQEVRLVFELFGKDHTYEIGTDDKKRNVHDLIYVTLTKSLSSKANFKKLFNAMQYGREDITHMAQMLNELFLVNVIIDEKGEKGKADYRRYAGLKKDGVWYVNAPVVEQINDLGEVTGTKKITVPEDTMLETISIFLWDQPNMDCWNDLYIDGTYEKEVNGKKEQVSKNWLQEKITGATNFAGSALENMLAGLEDAGVPEQKTDEEEEVDKGEDTPADDDTAGNEVDDALAVLGL